MLVFNSCLLLKCYVWLNESPNSFDIRPPSLEQYLPLDELMKPAPDVIDELLGYIYIYITIMCNKRMIDKIIIKI